MSVYVLTMLSHSACFAPFSSHDGTCFFVSTDYVGWTTAKTRCECIGGHLLMIKTAEQQQKVVSFLSAYSRSFIYILDSLIEH